MTDLNAPAPDRFPTDGASWVARLVSGQASHEDHIACTHWRSLSESNEADYQKARRAWMSAGALRATHRHKTPRWFQDRGVAAAAALVIVAALFVLSQSLPRLGAQERSYVADAGQQTRVELPSGADIMLNMRSEIVVLEQGAGTSVRLNRGEAFFNVEAGLDRTFVVRAGDAVVTVTGTAFEVAHFDTSTLVAVEHGSVRVAAGKGQSMDLDAGDRVLISADGTIRQLSEIPAEIVGAWQSGQLIFVDEPLSLVFARLQLYSEARIVLGQGVDRDLLVTATFANKDFDNVLANLSDSLPISIVKTTPGEIQVLPD